jgi:hypothetical protein
MRHAHIYRWTRTRRYRALSNQPGTFFAGQCWADYIITITEIDLRQTHLLRHRVTGNSTKVRVTADAHLQGSSRAIAHGDEVFGTHNYAKWPILIIAATVGLLQGWLWLSRRYPKTMWFILGFLQGLLGR